MPALPLLLVLGCAPRSALGSVRHNLYLCMLQTNRSWFCLQKYRQKQIQLLYAVACAYLPLILSVIQDEQEDRVRVLELLIDYVIVSIVQQYEECLLTLLYNRATSAELQVHTSLFLSVPPGCPCILSI